MKHSTDLRVTASVLALTMSAAAFAAGNTPIRDGRGALRAALSGQITGLEATYEIDTLSHHPRHLVKKTLDLLAAHTSPAALAAAPAGVEIPCGDSGTVHARMATKGPRLLRLEWRACAYTDAAGYNVLNGPAEVLLATNSFAATTLFGLKFGDRARDVSLDSPVADGSLRRSTRARWNLRLAGILPIGERVSEFGSFTGQYFFEATGIFEYTSFIPDFPNPGPPFYPQVQTSIAEGVVVAGEYSDTDHVLLARDNRFFTGKLIHSYQSPTTPTRAGRTRTESMRLQDLRVRYLLDYTGPGGLGRSSLSVDGKAEVILGNLWGFTGCTAPETYTFRTRAPLSTSFDYSDLLDTGELVINEKVTANYYVTGVEPYVDMVGHVDLSVRGLGDFAFTAPYAILDLGFEAGCTP